MSNQPLEGLDILLLVTDLTVGGANNSMKTMVEALLGLGARCQVWALSGEGPIKDALEAMGVPARCLHVPKHSHRLGTTRAVRRLLAAQRPDVVHTHNYEPNFHACRVRRALALPWLFITQHDPRMRLHRLLTNRWLRNVPDKVVVVSRGLGELYRKWCGYDPDRLFLLPNAVDTQRFAPRDKHVPTARELGVTGAFPVIGNVGGFGKLKGQEVLVRAFSQVLAQFPDARLVLVGDGKERPRVQALARRLGIHHAVIFAGHRTDVPEILTVLDMYVQPSWQEADPVALKEAMASGKPVISTATIGPSGMIRNGETGLLVPRGDWRAMAAELLRIARDDKLRLKLARGARRQAEEELSLEAYRSRLVQLYAPAIHWKTGREAG